MKTYLKTILSKPTEDGGMQTMRFAISQMRGKIDIIRIETNANGVEFSCIPSEVPTGLLDDHIKHAQADGWVLL